MSNKCPECSGDMKVEDSHWSYKSATEREEIKYYKCTNCDNQITERQ